MHHDFKSNNVIIQRKNGGDFQSTRGLEAFTRMMEPMKARQNLEPEYQQKGINCTLNILKSTHGYSLANTNLTVSAR